jgi:hypothetical protein
MISGFLSLYTTINLGIWGSNVTQLSSLGLIYLCNSSCSTAFAIYLEIRIKIGSINRQESSFCFFRIIRFYDNKLCRFFKYSPAIVLMESIKHTSPYICIHLRTSAWVGGTLLGNWVTVPAPTPALLPIRQAAGFAGGQ